MWKKIALALALSAPFVSPAVAGGVDDLVQLEILDGGLTDRGTYLGAVRLTLSDGWKTYWRAPGDAGIPPRFDWRGSRNVGEVSFTWPTPEVLEQNGLRTLGYEDQLVLPVEITPAKPGKPVRLKGSMDLGICKDVCVPGNLPINHTLDAQAKRNPAIAAALAQRPYSRREAGVRSATCSLSPTSDGMRIKAQVTMPSSGGREVAVIEPGNPMIWASAPETRRQGDTLTATADLVSNNGGPVALDRSEIRITVLGSKHAVDIVGCTPG